MNKWVWVKIIIFVVINRVTSMFCHVINQGVLWCGDMLLDKPMWLIQKKVDVHLLHVYFPGTSIGKRYARTDELGVPFAITVDSTSSVTIRERDSKVQVRVNVEEVAGVVKEVTDGQSRWIDILYKYHMPVPVLEEDEWIRRGYGCKVADGQSAWIDILHNGLCIDTYTHKHI